MTTKVFILLGAFTTMFCGLEEANKLSYSIGIKDSINKPLIDTIYFANNRRTIECSCLTKIMFDLRQDIIPANPRAFDDETTPSAKEKIHSQQTVFNYLNKDLKTKNFSKIKMQVSTLFFSKYSKSHDFDDIIAIKEWHLKNKKEAQSLFSDLNRIPKSKMRYELTVFSDEWLWYHHGNKVYFLSFPSYLEEFPFKDHVGQVVKSAIIEECGQ